MAITSIDIDAELLAEVKAITGARTNREAVDLSLKRVVQIQHQLGIIERASDPEVLEIVSHMHERQGAPSS